MAKRKVSNVLALAVLSLLTERPMHPYEISAVMRQRDISTVIRLNQSSLYSVIEALQRENLIIPVETQREGRYPERTVYRTTEAGQTELLDWVRSLIRQPATEYTQFAAGLAFLGHLSPAEVATLLEEHIRHLQEESASIRASLEKGHQLGVDRLFLTEDRYSLSMLDARIAFIREVIQEIHDGILAETIDGKLAWKVRRMDLAFLSEQATE